MKMVPILQGKMVCMWVWKRDTSLNPPHSHTPHSLTTLLLHSWPLHPSQLPLGLPPGPVSWRRQMIGWTPAEWGPCQPVSSTMNLLTLSGSDKVTPTLTADSEMAKTERWHEDGSPSRTNMKENLRASFCHLWGKGMKLVPEICIQLLFAPFKQAGFRLSSQAS